MMTPSHHLLKRKFSKEFKLLNKMPMKAFTILSEDLVILKFLKLYIAVNLKKWRVNLSSREYKSSSMKLCRMRLLKIHSIYKSRNLETILMSVLYSSCLLTINLYLIVYQLRLKDSKFWKK